MDSGEINRRFSPLPHRYRGSCTCFFISASGFSTGIKDSFRLRFVICSVVAVSGVA